MRKFYSSFLAVLLFVVSSVNQVSAQIPVSIFEAEPNGTSGTAQLLNLGAQNVTIVRGSINPGGDVEYFRIDGVAAGSKIWIVTDPGGTQVAGATSRDLLMDVLAADGTTVIENDDDDGTGNGGDGTIETGLASTIGGRTLVTGGTYYIRLTAFSATGIVNPYRLLIAVTPSGMGSAEVEANNTAATANSIVTGVQTIDIRTGAIDVAADEDYYSVDLQAGNILVINADADPERDGTGTDLVVEVRDPADALLLSFDSGITGSLANPSCESANYTITTSGTYYIKVRHFSATGTGTYHLMASAATGSALAATPLIITEFRLRGPSGANDEFVEVYNNSNSPYTVSASDGSLGYSVAASDGTVRFVIPNGTVIPQHGHYLGVNSVAYSLSGYPAGNGTTATGDATYTTDIPDNAGIALFRTSIPANFGLITRMDAVGSTAEANTLYKEGAGYFALTPFSIDYDFRRKTYDGPPQDSDNNAADFEFDDTNGTSAGAGQRLGVPGPENLSGPVSRDAGIVITRLDQSVGALAAPNFVRDLTSFPALNSTFGTIELRYRITNNTGVPLTRLRFRIDSIWTFPAPSGFADLRTRTTASVVVAGINDPATCAGPTPCSVTVEGTTMEQPPSQPNGGAFNTTMSVDAVTLGTPLAAGASINIRMLFGIQQTGNFVLKFTPEILPASAIVGNVPPPERIEGATDCSVTCPANITVSNDPNQCGAVVNYPPPTITGTCGTVTVSPASGSFFPIGTTTVTASSTAGPTCTFTITVNDTQAPTITCPANISLCGGSQAVSFTVTASDNCPGVTVVSSPASGSVFPVGITTVTCTATDASANTATCTFTVTILPIPSVNPVPNQTVCNGAPTAAVTFTGPVAGTTFSWVNNTPSIGLAASGTGNIASFTALNTGSAPVTATVTVTPSTGGGSAVQTFTNATPIIIPAVGTSGIANPYPSDIAVSGVVGTVTSVTVKLNNFNHTFPDDVDVLLVGPGGQNAIIMSDVGTSFDAVGVTLTLDDAAATNLPDAAQLVTGTFRPTNIGAGDAFAAPAPAPGGGSLLSVFNAINPNGTWSLYVVDDLGGDIGDFNGGWEISITSASAGPTCTGTPTTFTYTVNPTPTVVATPASQTLCSGNPITTIVLSGSAVSGTTYNWTRDNTVAATGIAASGAGNISGTMTNTTTSTVIVTFTITPIANGCPGTPITATVTVLPTPVITFTPAAPVICNGTIQQITASVLPPTLQTFSQPATIIVPAGAPSTTSGIAGPYPSQTNVAGLPTTGVTVKSVKLGNVNHTFPDDVDVVLVSPTGQAVILMSDVGGSADEIGRDYTLDDAAATLMADAALNPTGTYRPTNFGSTDNFPAPGPGSLTQATPTLATFSGNPNGNWSLYVVDDLGGDVGFIGNWNITFSIPSLVVFSPTTNLYTDALATIPYAGQPISVVYARPSTNTTYTATSTVDGCTGTATVTVTVNQLPAITSQPTPATQTICPGFNVTYSVTATGTGLTYQWKQGVTNLVDNAQISGATTNTLTITNVNSSNTGTYTCVVSGTCPPAVTSSPVVLNVATAPVISTQPANRTVCVGQTANFTVATVGSVPPPTIYQWQVSTDGGATWTNLTTGGSYTASFTTDPTTITMNNNRYRVLVTNSCGQTTTSGAAILTVNPLPTVTAVALPSRICISDTLVPLSGSPVGGSWSGTGVSGFNFVPSATAVGTYNLTYTYTNALGCTSSATVVAKVEDCQERLRLLRDDAVILYPNPNNGRFNIRINSTLYNYLGMKVYNVQGQLVNGTVVNDVLNSPSYTGLVYGRVIPINLTHLPAGVYMVKFYYDDGVRTSEKTFKVVIGGH